MPFVFLSLFLFMLYANPALLVPGLDVFRPAALAGIGATALLTMQKTAWGQSWKYGRPEGGLVVALIAAAGLSCIGAFWPRLAVDSTIDLFKIALIYFVIVNVVDSESRLKTAMIILIAGGLFPAAGAVKNYLQGNFMEGNRAAWIGTFANPNDLAYSVVILIPLALQMSRVMHWKWKPIFFAILGLYFAAIFATHSRGGLIGAGAVLLLIGLRQRGVFSKLVTAGALAAVLVFATYYWGRNEGFNNLSKDFTVHQRIETIAAGLRMFADHPIAGVGLGCSVVAWPIYAPADIDFKGSLIIHNTAVQALSELGLLGFVPFVLLLGAAWVHIRRLQKESIPDSDVQRYAVGLEAALFGYLICGLFGGYVLSWFPYIIIGLISALVALTQQQEEESREQELDEVHA
jgi:putative inorganic carbon (HCO3(-)) transporter